MKKEMYEKPQLTFVETELFEDVTPECWANPSLYCLVDPTDECKDIPGPYTSDNNYADLGGFKATANGCNANMKSKVVTYLKEHYGSPEKTGKPHYLSDEDIDTILASGGGNDGTSLKESIYIKQVRS